MKIILERDKCISCGSCSALCPKFWEMGEDAKANLKGSDKNEGTGNFELDLKNPTAEDKKCNKEAAYVCPVQVIKVER